MSGGGTHRLERPLHRRDDRRRSLHRDRPERRRQRHRQVSVVVPNAAPTIATAAAASPNPVTGSTTALSVLGADDGGEANLTYTWATTGTPPAAVTFSANGTNAAKTTTATFTKAGSYTLQVDRQGSGRPDGHQLGRGHGQPDADQHRRLSDQRHGQHLRDPAVHRHRARSVRDQPDHPADLHLDRERRRHASARAACSPPARPRVVPSR